MRAYLKIGTILRSDIFNFGVYLIYIPSFYYKEDHGKINDGFGIMIPVFIHLPIVY